MLKLNDHVRIIATESYNKDWHGHEGVITEHRPGLPGEWRVFEWRVFFDPGFGLGVPDCCFATKELVKING